MPAQNQSHVACTETAPAAPMQHLGQLDGKNCYWAEPGRFVKPGFYFWDGTRNVHVPLPEPDPAEEGAVGSATSRGPLGLD